MSMVWICSRRKAEEYIQSWEVFINWKKAEIWESVDPHKDIVKLWDTAIKRQSEYVYYKYNKPRWIETTCAQKWWKSIIDTIDIKERVFPVWRLDKESTWLILLTNDGRITNYLTHPKYEHEKEYVVEVFWPIHDESLLKMSSWLPILWKITKTCDIKRISSWKFSIILTEWMNRQIRRMVEKVWSKVKKLHRVRVGQILLWKLSSWSYTVLNKSEKKYIDSILKNLSE